MPSLLDQFISPAAQADKPFWNDAAEVGRQFVGGAVVDLPRQLGQGLRRIAPDNSVLDNFGRDVVESADARAPGWAPDTAGRGPIADTLMKGARGLAPMATGLAAGVVNPLLGAGVMAGQFGLSSAQDTEDKLRLQGVPDDQATQAGMYTGALQGLGEAAAGYVGAKFLRPLLPGSAPTMQSALQQATDTRVLSPFLKGMGINMLVQPTTEVAQDVGTEFIERSYGAAPEDAWSIAKDSAQGAVGMTALLGPLAFLGHRSRSRQAAQLADELAPLQDPNAPPVAQQMALARAVEIGQQLKVSPEQINAWLDSQRVAPPDLQQREPGGPRQSFPVDFPINTAVTDPNSARAGLPMDPRTQVPPEFQDNPIPNGPQWRFDPLPMLEGPGSQRSAPTSQTMGAPGVINVTPGGTAAPMGALSGQQYDMFGGQDTFGDTGTLPQRPEALNPNPAPQSLARPDGQTRDMFTETPTSMVGAGDAFVPSAIRSQIMQRLGSKGDGSRQVGKTVPDGLTMRLGIDLSRLMSNEQQANAHLDGVEQGLLKNLETLDRQVSGGSNKLTPEEYGAKRQVIDNRLLIVEAAREVVADSARARTQAYADEARARGPQNSTLRVDDAANQQTDGSAGTVNEMRQNSIRTATSEVDQRTDTRRRSEADAQRMDILRQVLAEPTRNNPVARFQRALTQAGFKNLALTPSEQETINRVTRRRDDVRAAATEPPALAARNGRLTPRASLDAQQQEAPDVSVADAPQPGPASGSAERLPDQRGSVVDSGPVAAADGQPAAPATPRGVGANGQAMEAWGVGTTRRAPRPVAAPADADLAQAEAAVREGRASTAGSTRLARLVSELTELDQRIAAAKAQGALPTSKVMRDLMTERRSAQGAIDRAQEAQGRTQDKKTAQKAAKADWEGTKEAERKLGKSTSKSKANAESADLRMRLTGIMADDNAPIQHRERAKRLEAMLRDPDMNESVADVVTNVKFAEAELEAMQATTWRAGSDAQPATHVSRETLESALEDVRSKTPGSPTVVILDRGSQIGIPDTVLGAVHEGKVHIFLEATPNKLEALKTIWHEFFHVGFANWLGARPYAQTLISLSTKDAVVRKYAAEWRISTEGVGRRKYMSYNDWHARSVEEALARIAEDLKTKGGSRQMNATVKRIVDWAADVADKLGLKGLGDSLRKMSMTDMEKFVSDMIDRAGGDGPGGSRFRQNTQRDANFVKWFGESKIVNADGTPKVMYHGTARDITEFKAKQAGAIFVTPNPKFAEGFADASKGHVREEILGNITPAQRQDALGDAEDQIRADYADTPGLADTLIEELYQGDKNTLPPGEAGEYFVNAAMRYANVGENVLPLYVRAENPFDYGDVAQIDAVLDKVYAGKSTIRVGALTVDRQDARAMLIRGEWNIVEAPEVQQVLKELGHDAFYVSEGGVKNLAVYDPNQLKSATGNDGTYSRENNDIRFREARPEVVEATIQSYPAKLRPMARALHKMLGGAGRRVLSKVMFTNDLMDQAIKAGLKSAREYQALHNKQASEVGAHEAKIDAVIDDYNRLPEKLKGRGPGTVNDFLYNSTRAAKWGYKPDFIDADIQVDADIAREYAALGKEGQAFVDRVFRMGYESLQEKKAAALEHTKSEYDVLIKAAQDEGDEAKVKELTAEKTKTMEQFGSLMRLSGNIPYAPLRRYGEFVVVAKSREYLAADDEERKKLARDENHYRVDFVENEYAAARLEQELEASGQYAPKSAGGVEYSQRSEEVDSQLYGGSKTIQAFSRLRVQIKAHYDGLAEKAQTPEDKARAKELEAAASRMRRIVTDLYLHTLAETGARQAERRRKSVAGEIDMVRSFATQGKADANFIGWLKYSSDTLEALGRMRREVQEGRGTAEKLPRSEYFNEIMRRHMQAMEYKPTPLADWLTGVTSKWYLAFAPSYYLQNATQPWMMSLPVMAAKHGYGGAASALSKAYGDIAALWPKADNLTKRADFRALLDNKKLDADERKMLSDLIDAQQLDVGMITEIGQFRIEDDNTVKAGFQKISNSLRHLQSRMEAINRASTALAAYRLEKAKGGDGFAYASRIIQETHGDYSAWNAPRAFNTGLGKAALQFRKFQLIQLSMMAKLLSGSLAKANTAEAKAERAVARKAFLYVLGQAMAVGGTKALPAIGALGWVFSKAFGDTGDEPPEYLLRQFIGDKDLADLILDGPLAKVSGLNMGAFGGMSNMLSPLPFTDISLGREGVKEATFAILAGPAGGLAGRVAEGLKQMQAGDFVRGLEGTLPKGFSSALKALREGTEGVRQQDGDMQLSPDDVNVLESVWTGLGFQTQDATRRRFEQETSFRVERGMDERVSRIKKDYTEAVRDGDRDAAAEAIADWRDLQEKRRNMGFTPMPLSTLLKSPQEQRKREATRVGTLQTQKSDRGFREKVAGF